MSAIDKRFVWAKMRGKERNIGCLLWGLQDVAGSIHFSMFHGRGSTRGALPCVRCCFCLFDPRGRRVPWLMLNALAALRVGLVGA